MRPRSRATILRILFVSWSVAVAGQFVRTLMLRQLDHEAALRGITRQSLIKTWLYERLQNESPQRAIAKAIIGGSPEQMSEAVRQMERAVEDVLEKHRTGKKAKWVRAS